VPNLPKVVFGRDDSHVPPTSLSEGGSRKQDKKRSRERRSGSHDVSWILAKTIP
jgi:hypothetical protein